MSHIFSDKKKKLIIITSDVFFFKKKKSQVMSCAYFYCLFLYGKIFLDAECYKRSMYVRVCDQFHLIAYLSSFIVSSSMKNYSPKMIAQLIFLLDLFITHQLALYLVFVIVRLTLAARSSPNWRSQWSRSFKNWQTKICKLGAYIVLIKLNELEKYNLSAIKEYIIL
jgi:hypothetical protein